MKRNKVEYMSSKNSKNIRGSYIVSAVSIALVLFLVGITAFLVLNAKQISDYVKENIGFSVIIKEDVKSVDVKMFQKVLEAQDFTRKTKYIDKETAAKEFSEEVGSDFVSFLGYNPLLASIDIKLNPVYANQDSISVIEKKLLSFDVVQEVNYQKSLVSEVNNNVKKISVILLSISILLLLISFALIRNTVHLSIYSQRFTINTMQLVGATSAFIRRPFVGKSVLHGLIAAIMANAVIIAILWFANDKIGGVVDFFDYKLIGLMAAVVFAVGIVITLICTLFAVNKYLRKDINELYS